MSPIPDKPIKILAFCDAPTCFSGFAQVSRNILAKMHEMGFEIIVWGVNQSFELDDYGRLIGSEYPYEILPASYLSMENKEKGYSHDPYGREKLVKYMAENDFDIFWSVQDPYCLEGVFEKFETIKQKFKKDFKTIFYFPVDAYGISEKWAKIPSSFDYPVVYTEFGKERVLSLNPEIESKLQVIYHGTNTKDFYPLPEADKAIIRENLGIDKDTCVILNVNRNQPRKDLARSLQVFAKFKEKVPNSKLFLFCKNNDIGGNLLARAKYYGLTNDDLIFPNLPTGKDEFKGVPIEIVNQVYNISDMVISTTLGEGWGLSLTEAMACKIPVVFPNHSSITEIIGANEERGFLASAGTTESEYIHLPSVVDDPLRPLTNIEDMLSKMIYIWQNKDTSEIKSKVETAYNWVQERTWDIIFNQQWKPILEEIKQNIKI